MTGRTIKKTDIKMASALADLAKNVLRTGLVLVCVLVCVGILGCEPSNTALDRPPHNLGELEAMPEDGPGSYTDHTVLLVNTMRVADVDLNEQDRMDSLQIVKNLDAPGETVVGRYLGPVYYNPQTPPALKKEIGTILQGIETAGIPRVITPQPVRPEKLSDDELSNWLDDAREGKDPMLLAELTKRWADQPQGPAGAHEEKFKKAAQAITGKDWPQALVEGINSSSFSARGSAIQVLHDRLKTEDIGKRILKLTGKTDAMKALQTFVEKFEFVPADGKEFLSVATIYKTHAGLIDETARLFNLWRVNYNYKFNIRDFYLLSELAMDPLKDEISRNQLIIDLQRKFASRKHVSCKAARAKGQDSSNFLGASDKLTMADLWNIKLLNEMVSLPRVQKSLKIMYRGDYRDKKAAWGGLVFYQSGRAKAILYPPKRGMAGSDLVYIPTQRVQNDNRDALARFSGHFSKPQNASHAGPAASELQDAKTQNYYGLIITSISPDDFSAYYYNPEGEIISLGILPLR